MNQNKSNQSFDATIKNKFLCPMDFVIPFLKGLATGMGLSMALGTVFFAIIHHSIQRGYKAGVKIAAGVLVSDVLFVSLVMSGSFLSSFLDKYEQEASITGASILSLFGLVQVLYHRKVPPVTVDTQGSDWTLYLKGFFLNVINPVNFFVWVLISVTLLTYGYETPQMIAFFSGTILSIFLTESALALFAASMSRWLTDSVKKTLQRVSGFVFLMIGLYLLIKAIWQY
jgi:L-lysine exporter family protein LysE/ArgO